MLFLLLLAHACMYIRTNLDDTNKPAKVRLEPIMPA